MSIFRETFFIYRRNLKIWRAQPAVAIAPVFTAAFMFLLFAAPLGEITNLPNFPTGDYEAFLTGMIIVMTVVFSGADVAMALLTDVMSGYFDKLLLAPINRFSILMGTLLIAGTRALLQVLAIVIIAYILGVRFEGGIAGLAAVIVAATVFGIAFACVGVIIAMRTKSIQITQTSWLMFMPLAFMTTAFMPEELLTGWFKIAVAANPVDYVLVGIRTIIVVGWDWTPILTGLWVLAAMTVVLLTAATWVYRRATT